MEASEGASGASGSTAPHCVLTEEEPKDIYKGSVKLTPARMEKVKAINQQMRDASWSDCFLIIDEEAGIVQSVVSRDLEKDSLDGAQTSISEVGSVEEFTEKDSTNGTHSEEKTVVTAGIGRDIPDHLGHESREAEDAKENGANEGITGSTGLYRFSKQEPIVIYERPVPMPPVEVSAIALEQFKGWNQENQRLGIQEYFIIDEEASTVQHRTFSSLNANSLGGAPASSSEQNTAVAGGGGVSTTPQRTPRPIIASPPPALSQTPLTPPGLPPRPYPQITPKSLIDVLASRSFVDIPDHNGHEIRETEAEKEYGKNQKNGEAEVNATEVEGVVAEKNRKSIAEEKTVVTAGIGRNIPDHIGHESREAEDAKENGAKPKEVPGTTAPRRSFTKEQLKSIYDAHVPIPPVKFSDTGLEPFRACNQENRRRGVKEWYIIDESASTVQHRKQHLTFRSYWNAYCLSVAQGSSSDENAGDIPDHDGDESPEADDAKENGDCGQCSECYYCRLAEEEDRVKGEKGGAKADSTEIEEVVAEKSPKKACNEGTEEVVDAPNSGDSVEAAVV